jgi:hypothetical protein
LVGGIETGAPGEHGSQGDGKNVPLFWLRTAKSQGRSLVFAHPPQLHDEEHEHDPPHPQPPPLLQAEQPQLHPHDRFGAQGSSLQGFVSAHGSPQISGPAGRITSTAPAFVPNIDRLRRL